MKRITVLALALALVLGSAVAAQADGIDIKVKGQWDFSFGWTNNMNLSGSYMPRNTGYKNGRSMKDDHFQASQRVRTQVNFISSEFLQALVMFEIGDLNWGQGKGKEGRSSGADLDSDGVNIETKRAYLDWVIPQTEISIRMGIQGLKLPSTPMGSPVFDADVAGILASAPITDWLSASLFWIRPFDAGYNDSVFGRRVFDEVDAFGLVLPMDFADAGVKFNPWFIYGMVGAHSGMYEYLFAATKPSYGAPGNYTIDNKKRNNVYWIGAHLEYVPHSLSNLVFNLEGIYGRLARIDLDGFANGAISGPGETRVGTSGWFIASTLDYKLDFMTPGIFGWYASGDKRDSGKTGKLRRMPVLGNDGGSFGPTSFGSSGYYGLNQLNNSGVIMGTGTGTWGLGIQLADMSFIEDLTHTVRVAYYKGTNDHRNVRDYDGHDFQYSADRFYLTNKDSVWEVNFDHQYKIYENLTAVLELGWLRLHADKNTWRPVNVSNNGLKSNDNAWKAQVAFRYSF